ncbi:fibronectin type III domain-containing protein [Candidatus Azambacteria bacterium]|nr:fibronectin type III domain-containing protein [Candidatus Azambacteria bacterium]
MNQAFFIRMWKVCFVAFALLFFFETTPPAFAASAPQPCAKPPNYYDASIVFSHPYDPNPTPKNNQLFCSTNYTSNSEPDIIYNCYETTSNILRCDHYLDPSNYYTCTYLGTGVNASGFYYGGYIYDNCTLSLPLPSVALTASVSSVTLGSSSTLTWSSSNATSCTASGAWSGSKALSGSETVTPSATGVFSYTLSCTGAGGTTAQSVSITVNSPPDTTSPSVPADLTATAVSTSHQINLTWTASTDNVGVTGYAVEQCIGTGCASFTQIGTSPVASYSNTGLTPSTAYSYRVRAYDAAGNFSGYSNTAFRER